MTIQRPIASSALFFLLSFACVLAIVPQDLRADPPQSIRIGLVKTMFRDVPSSMVQMLKVPFSVLLHAQTGLNGSLEILEDEEEVAAQLAAGKLHLGVLHGFEFAWIQERFQDLMPLMIAVNRHRDLSASLVTRKDHEADGLDDLKGTCLSLPKMSREHCHLFLNRQCESLGCPPESFFSKIVNHRNVELGLDDVVRGKAQAIVVDNVSLECYEQVKPGCFARLKVLQTSETFPSAVIVYKKGGLDEATLNKFKNGMISANQDRRSRELMSMWKLTGFEPIPANYQTLLSSIRKAYPPPARAVGATNSKDRTGE